MGWVARELNESDRKASSSPRSHLGRMRVLGESHAGSWAEEAVAASTAQQASNAINKNQPSPARAVGASGLDHIGDQIPCISWLDVDWSLDETRLT